MSSYGAEGAAPPGLWTEEDPKEKDTQFFKNEKVTYMKEYIFSHMHTHHV